MRFSATDVRIADVETCDFGLMPHYDTAAVLRAARPDDWNRYLDSAAARRLISELGVRRRHLTHLPGQPPRPGRLTAHDLACSTIERLMVRRQCELQRLDALIYVSTSNPYPCNSQAAMLAERFGLRASCIDLKAGCSGGVLGLLQAALLIRHGCERVLVVMAETLSQLAPCHDLRMLLTVGDGAACVLLERCPGPGFLEMVHGTEPEFARTMMVPSTFPPTSPDTRYQYEFRDTAPAREYLHAKWRSLYHDVLAAAGLESDQVARWFFHQTHGAQVDDLLRDLGVAQDRTVRVVGEYGNMGTPTFAVALALGFPDLYPGDRYLLQAVGGGMSWCAIAAEHC